MIGLPILIILGCFYLYWRLGKIEKDLDNGPYGNYSSRPYIDKSVNITHDNRTFVDNRKVTINQLPQNSHRSSQNHPPQ